MNMSIELAAVTARIADDVELMDINLWSTGNQHWAVIGANGSGKSAFGQLLCGRLQILSGSATLPRKSASVSFEEVTSILDHEHYLDNSNYCGGYDPGTATRDFIAVADPLRLKRLQALEEQFQLTPLLDRGIKFLSTGEMRKALICRALIDEPELLVLDEPFDGLDRDSCAVLRELITQIVHSGIQLVLLLNRYDEIHPDITHIARLDRCRLVASGSKTEMLAELEKQRHNQIPATILKHYRPRQQAAETDRQQQPIIEMRDVNVVYREKAILDRFDWRVMPDEHWMISGPNGAGKTTLLNLITGANSQAYANYIHLFGRRKGSGESVWEIKARIGHVSTAFQRDYRVGGSVLSVIVSGFFDSIGVYQAPNRKQRELALAWLDHLHLAHLAGKPFRALSFGEQRLILLARAMVKGPQLLILDEPCQGLDETNRNMILELIQQIGASGLSQLLYVTHHPEDDIPCINRHLQFIPSGTMGGYAGVVTQY